QAKTDHGARIAGLRSLPVESLRLLVAAGHPCRSRKQSGVVGDFRARLLRLAAQSDCGLAALSQIIHFDAVDAGGGVVRMGRETLARKFCRRRRLLGGAKRCDERLGVLDVSPVWIARKIELHEARQTATARKGPQHILGVALSRRRSCSGLSGSSQE